jgi:type IV pilus assembly protein PilQ
MRIALPARPVSARVIASARGARWVVVLVAVAVWSVAANPAARSQTLELHDAFNEVHEKIADGEQSVAGDVRVAQKATTKPAAKASQPTTKKKVAAARPNGGVKQPGSESESGAPNLPMPAMEETLPLGGVDHTDKNLELTTNESTGLITLIVRDKSLSQVLALIAQTQHLNIVASNDIDALISITLRDVPIEEAMTAILSVANYTWVKRNNIILITSLTDATNLPADVQGRQIQVFDLDFASAAVVAETTKNFLSPVGKISFGSSNPANNRMTQERIVIEDTPDSLCRIADYIAQIDQPPRQVLIEAHVLQINLDDTTRCGVNLDQLIRLNGANFNLTTVGFANKNAPQGFLSTLDGGDLGGVIELIQTTTDAKTLGSPKLLVLNEQEARLQVGEHLGFKVTTTTETSTLESVQFLDVGVVLRIVPRITRDNRVLLHVKPEVSKGAVNPETGLPESQTAELETDVMLNDNQGMVIGGLIKENDTTTQNKVPYLGNVKGIGFLFRRSETTKERVEIIVALVPRIQPYNCEYHDFEQGELVKAGVPLMHGPLCRTDRPWDPILPDGKRVYYPLIPKKFRPNGYYHDLGPQYAIPPTPLPTQEFCEPGCEPNGCAPMPRASYMPMNRRSGSAMAAPAQQGNQGEVISDQQ